jgi:segregation and condensation protein A
MSYRVALDIFEGPLDLLLYLARRSEVDVLDLPIAKITAQFVEFLDVLELFDLDSIGEFLVTASTLLEIKSRMVLPSPEENQETAEEDEEDPRSDLIRQLLEYKRYKDAAQALEEHAAQWQDRFPRLSNDRPTQGKDHAVDRIKEVELWDLVSALSRVLKRKDIEQESRIRYDDTPISVYIEQVSARVRAEGRVAFSSLFEGTSHRSRIISLFLAVLELLRHHEFRAVQQQDFGEIWVLPPASGAENADAGLSVTAESLLDEELPSILGDEPDSPDS